MNTATTTQVKHGQQAIISGVRNDNTLFTFGTVEGYTTANNEQKAKWASPIPPVSIQDALDRAKARGHEIAWANPEACVIVDTKTYPNYYNERVARIASAVRLAAGDVVELEGRLYRLEAAPNHNVALKPVAA